MQDQLKCRQRKGKGDLNYLIAQNHQIKQLKLAECCKNLSDRPNMSTAGQPSELTSPKLHLVVQLQITINVLAIRTKGPALSQS